MKFSLLWPALLAAFALATTAASAQALNSTGPLPQAPSAIAQTLTPESNDAYARAVLSNRRPYDPDERGTADFTIRDLKYRLKLPVTFTWDRAYAESTAKSQLLITDYIDEVANVIRSRSTPDFAGPVWVARMQKIKRVHFTVTDQPITQQQRTYYCGNQGYVLSWNQAAGVLTVALNKARFINAMALDAAGLEKFMGDNIK